jgi:hypothetical protein
VGNGDIEALAPGALKLPHGFLEFLGRHVQQLVLHFLPGLLCEQAVYDGRPAVCHRVAHDAITVKRHRLRYQERLPGREDTYSLSQRAASIAK